MFYELVLGILQRDTNPYIKPTDVCNFWYQNKKGIFSFCGNSFQYFMVPYSTQFMKRLGIQATFGKSLKDIYYIV